MSERAEESLDIRRAALRLLARREHSVVELLRKLSRRFPEKITVIKEELESLNQEGLPLICHGPCCQKLLIYLAPT